jgi:hypothetical protein
MARWPKYQPSEAHRREVLAMTGFGILQNDIARMLEIDPKTLRKHYRRELDTGATQANARVAQTLYLMATKEKNVAACIWWTKCRMQPPGKAIRRIHRSWLISDGRMRRLSLPLGCLSSKPWPRPPTTMRPRCSGKPARPPTEQPLRGRQLSVAVRKHACGDLVGFGSF